MEKIMVNSMQHYLEQAWSAFLDLHQDIPEETSTPFSQKDSAVFCTTPTGNVQIYELKDLSQREMHISILQDRICFEFNGGKYKTTIKFQKDAAMKSLEITEILKTDCCYMKSEE